MWDVWVTGVPANQLALTQDPTIYSSFMDTGSYAYKIQANVILISLNGMYPFDENASDQAQAGVMISWMEQVFIDNPDSRFILQYHVWPGCNFYYSQECFWV